MITLGLDPHPGSHTVVALDSNGACLGHLKVLNNAEGLAQLHEFAAAFSPRQWAVEGAGNRFIADFVAQLLSGSETVFSIPPGLRASIVPAAGEKRTTLSMRRMWRGRLWRTHNCRNSTSLNRRRNCRN